MQSFFGNGAYLNVDMSDVSRLIDFLRGIMTPEKFERLIYRTFGEVGKRSKTIISRAVRQEYAAQDGWIRSQIGQYQLTMGGEYPVTCKIPLKGAKGVLGRIFQASGRGGGITAKIVRGSASRLPRVMSNQGGNPPFMGRGALGGAVFTRRTKSRFPIVRVVGLAVPQMPLNRSAEQTQEQIINLCAQRLEHNFLYMLSSGR